MATSKETPQQPDKPYLRPGETSMDADLWLRLLAESESPYWEERIGRFVTTPKKLRIDLRTSDPSNEDSAIDAFRAGTDKLPPADTEDSNGDT